MYLEHENYYRREWHIEKHGSAPIVIQAEYLVYANLIHQYLQIDYFLKPMSLMNKTKVKTDIIILL